MSTHNIRCMSGKHIRTALYLFYTYDLSSTAATTTKTFGDDTVIFAIYETLVIAFFNLQHLLNLLETWFNKWKIKVNEPLSCPLVNINWNNIFQWGNIKYFDNKLNWKSIKKERTQIKIPKSFICSLEGRLICLWKTNY